MEYSEKRQLRKKNAEENTKRRETQYAKEIKECYENTVIYNREEINDFWSNEPVKFIPNVQIVDCGSVQAICEYKSLEYEVLRKNEDKIAVLNFASFKHPGGGYIIGTHAQEECLCEESFLYNVLRKFENTWYKENLNHLNNSLYADRGLYTPNVLFLANSKTGRTEPCDVITVACPNWKSYQEHFNKNSSFMPIEDANMKALRDRCRFILEIAKRQKVHTLILGAFGCGVFKQNPKDVAFIFKDLLETYDYGITFVEFAIPSFNTQSKSDNLGTFKKVFSKYKGQTWGIF